MTVLAAAASASGGVWIFCFFFAATFVGVFWVVARSGPPRPGTKRHLDAQMRAAEQAELVAARRRDVRDALRHD